MKKCFILLVISILFVMPKAAFAHHSAAPHFDMATTVEIEGVITKLSLVNPHAYVYFEVIENNQTEEWRCELRAGTILERVDWNENTLPVGARMLIKGSPARREDFVCKTNMISLGGGEMVDVMEVAHTYPGTGNPSLENNLQTLAEDSYDRPDFVEGGQPNISGYWLAAGRIASGRAQLPQTAAGIEASKSWDYRFDFAELNCQGSNIFETLHHDRHVNQFIQSEDRIILQYGFMDVRRVVHLDQDRHPDNIEPSMQGFSIGHWQGNTLIVNTRGFAQGALIPPNGILHSNQMQVTEHFTFDSDGNLDWQFEAIDPFLQEPYSDGLRLVRSDKPYVPYNCVELSGQNNIRAEE